MQMEPLDLTTKSNPVKAHVHKPFSDDETEKKKLDGEVFIHVFPFTLFFYFIITAPENRLISFQGHWHKFSKLDNIPNMYVNHIQALNLSQKPATEKIVGLEHSAIYKYMQQEGMFTGNLNADGSTPRLMTPGSRDSSSAERTTPEVSGLYKLMASKKFSELK